MNLKEMRTKSADDLNKELLELRKAQFGLRMQQATQQLTNTSELGKMKRNIARIKTVLNEKSRAA
ncbi:MAG: 50S ribosomal protein L29 [Burkholderiales bacterium]|jgi:large subunit ribosomal protein L29|nr:50S ribosomal protein L29 [Burkholderiales bacterium]